MIRQSFQILFVAFLVSTRTWAIAYADDEMDDAADALRPANQIPWSVMTVRILNPEGEPVPGVNVKPWALRAGNGHGIWDPDAIGAPLTSITDEKGLAKVVFPLRLSWSLDEPVSVSEVSMFLNHPDFRAENTHVPVPTADPEIVSDLKLNRGFRLRIAGVAPGTETPLSDCHVLLEGQASRREFVADAEGWMQSIPISPERRWFRVVRMASGEPHQFSRLQAWSPDDPASREVRVEVRPGTRVTGKISDAVPRPITRGRVVVWCGSPVRFEQGVNQVKVTPNWWIDTVPIAEDGSFEFKSLPSGYLAQFYAFANDWITSQPTEAMFQTCCKWFAEENRPFNDFFRYGQILRLATGKSEVTLDMEPAGQIRIKCLDPKGRPIRRISVSSWPNQYMVGGGSTLFCNRQLSAESLQGLSNKEDWKRPDNPFYAETNDVGEALLTNLPKGKCTIYAGNTVWKSQEKAIEVIEEKTSDVELAFERSR